MRHENLPELICRPCERRIGNFKAFRLKIQESQKKFEQFSKRCVEISPSVFPPAKTVRRVPTSLTKTASARTRLNFTGDEVSLISKLLLKFMCHTFLALIYSEIPHTDKNLDFPKSFPGPYMARFTSSVERTFVTCSAPNITGGKIHR